MYLQFMLRQEVLSLYRQLIRTCKMIPDETTSKEMTDWVRGDFRKNIHLDEEVGVMTC